MTNAIERSKIKDVLRWNKKKKDTLRKKTRLVRWDLMKKPNEETEWIGDSIFALLTVKRKNPKWSLLSSKPRHRQDRLQEWQKRNWKGDRENPIKTTQWQIADLNRETEISYKAKISLKGLLFGDDSTRFFARDELRRRRWEERVRRRCRDDDGSGLVRGGFDRSRSICDLGNDSGECLVIVGRRWPTRRGTPGESGSKGRRRIKRGGSVDQRRSTLIAWRTLPSLLRINPTIDLGQDRWINETRRMRVVTQQVSIIDPINAFGKTWHLQLNPIFRCRAKQSCIFAMKVGWMDEWMDRQTHTNAS